MRFLPLVLLLGCSVGLVNETKPITADTADLDTADTEETPDTGNPVDDTDTDTQPTSENPNAGECDDGVDNDGDGRTDCDDSDCVSAQNCQGNPQDADGDGYPDSQDCDPYNASIHPGAAEVPNNGRDDDCDGVVDSGSSTDTGGTGTDTGNPTPGTLCSNTCVPSIDNLFSASANDGSCQDGGDGDLISWGLGVSGCALGTDCADCGTRVDADGDGHMPDPSGLGIGLYLYFDCDDTNPNINSAATDIPGNGIDEDCDGSDATSTSAPTSESNCSDGVDDDQDGQTDCADSDCSADPACTSSSGGCAAGELLDCSGNCSFSAYLGDGLICDDGVQFSSDFDCAQYNYDGGDCSSSGNCPAEEVEDCNGNCVPTDWIGDSYCDSGAYDHNGVYIYLDCPSFNNDAGDCP
jgi:hypothetical protein